MTYVHHQQKPYICACGRNNDMATDPYQRNHPEPNDISVCFNCGRLAQWSYAMELQPVGDEVLQHVDVHGRAMIALLRQDIRERKRGSAQPTGEVRTGAPGVRPDDADQGAAQLDGEAADQLRPDG